MASVIRGMMEPKGYKIWRRQESKDEISRSMKAYLMLLYRGLQEMGGSITFTNPWGSEPTKIKLGTNEVTILDRENKRVDGYKLEANRYGSCFDLLEYLTYSRCYGGHNLNLERLGPALDEISKTRSGQGISKGDIKETTKQIIVS